MFHKKSREKGIQMIPIYLPCEIEPKRPYISNPRRSLIGFMICLSAVIGNSLQGLFAYYAFSFTDYLTGFYVIHGIIICFVLMSIPGVFALLVKSKKENCLMAGGGWVICCMVVDLIASIAVMISTWEHFILILGFSISTIFCAIELIGGIIAYKDGLALEKENVENYESPFQFSRMNSTKSSSGK